MRHRALPTGTSPKPSSALVTPVAALRASAPHKSFDTRPTPCVSRPTTAVSALLFTCIDDHSTGYNRGEPGFSGPYRSSWSNMGQYGAVRGRTVEIGAVEGSTTEN